MAHFIGGEAALDQPGAVADLAPGGDVRRIEVPVERPRPAIVPKSGSGRVRTRPRRRRRRCIGRAARVCSTSVRKWVRTISMLSGGNEEFRKRRLSWQFLQQLRRKLRQRIVPRTHDGDRGRRAGPVRRCACRNRRARDIFALFRRLLQSVARSARVPSLSGRPCRRNRPGRTGW